MDNLPLEAFESIIQILDNETQANCARVSISWNRNMKHTHLFAQKLYFTGIKEISKFQRPFVKIVALRSGTHEIGKGSRKSYAGKKNDTFEGWSSMKFMEEASQSMYTPFLLNHTTQPFRNLTRLWLNYIFINAQKANDIIDYLVKGLANAPNLQELLVQEHSLTLKDLDNLHDVCKNLEILSLHEVSLMAHPSAPKPRNVMEIPNLYYQPEEAPKMRKFYYLTSHLRNGVPLLGYIQAKYKNIENVAITDD